MYMRQLAMKSRAVIGRRSLHWACGWMNYGARWRVRVCPLALEMMFGLYEKFG